MLSKKTAGFLNPLTKKLGQKIAKGVSTLKGQDTAQAPVADTSVDGHARVSDTHRCASCLQRYLLVRPGGDVRGPGS